MKQCRPIARGGGGGGVPGVRLNPTFFLGAEKKNVNYVDTSKLDLLIYKQPSSSD